MVDCQVGVDDFDALSRRPGTSLGNANAKSHDALAQVGTTTDMPYRGCLFKVVCLSKGCGRREIGLYRKEEESKDHHVHGPHAQTGCTDFVITCPALCQICKCFTDTEND